MAHYITHSHISTTDFEAFFSLSKTLNPAILLEGHRTVPAEVAPLLLELGWILAVRWPSARFWSGNAPGSDTFFAEGVVSVDPARLEYVAPY